MARNRNNDNKFNKNNNNNRKGSKSNDRKTPRSGNNSGHIPETLKRDIGNFNWYKPIGTKVDTRGWYTSVPSVAAIKVQPSLGISNSSMSPTHQMARILYNYIVRINATSCPYEPVDLQLGMLAVGELYKFVLWATRLYKYANTYSIYNRAIPKLLFSADYVNPTAFLKTMADYRAWLNTFIQRCSTLCFPGNIAFFDNLTELYSDVYVDENSERAQIIVFTPHVFYKYDETTMPYGILTPILPGYHRRSTVSVKDLAEIPQFSDQWGTKQNPFIHDDVMDFDAIKKIGEELLESLLKSEDICRICSDIRNAYDTSKLLHFDLVDESATLNFIYSDKLNMMIENAAMLGRPTVDTQTGDIVTNGIYAPSVTQIPDIDAGYLIFNMYGGARSTHYNEANLTYHLASDYVFNVHDDYDVTPDDMVNMARFVPCLNFTQYGSSTDAMSPMIESCGTEVITEASILSVDASGNTIVTDVTSPFIFFNGDVSNDKASLDRLTKINAFRVFPRVTVVIGHDGSTNTMIREMIEFDKYTTVPRLDIKQIHEAYLLNQYMIPDYHYTAR